MNVKKSLTTFAIAFIALISSCSKDNFQEVIGVCPVVVSTIPADGASGVSLNQVITATFNEAMNPATITQSSFIITTAAGAVSGAVTYSGTIATFTPTNPLAPNTLYTGRITTLAKDLTGNALQADYVWTFTTFNPVNTNLPPVDTTSGLGFGVFGGNAGITNQGLNTKVYGSIGTTAASTLVTGFTDGTNGDVYTVTPLNNGLVTNGIYTDAPAPGNADKAKIALDGLNAARTLYEKISPASMPNGNAVAGELGGLTLAPGIYTAASSFAITNGDLTLNANGDANAKWYFQAPSSLTVGDNLASSVILTGGALAKNVYWYVGSTAVINYAGGGVMVGNIIANSGVTLSSPANSTTPVGAETVLNGRAISLVSSVTMVNTIINVPAN